MAEQAFPRFRRRHFFVNKKMQSRFVIGFALAVFAGIFLNMLLVYFLIDRELTAELYKIHIKVRTTSEIALPILWKLTVATVPVIVVVAALIGRFLLKRVEAPMAGLKGSVARVGAGEFAERISPDSAPSGLPESFNGMADCFEDGFRVVIDSAAAMERSFNELSLTQKGTASSRSDLKRILDNLASERKRAQKEISRFKL
jgi:methyl-accepting chemotaxis protein